MIGVWQRFGQGQPPEDGEVVVFVEFYGYDIFDILENRIGGRAIVAMHRYGYLTTQDGSGYSPPSGCWWTSLPNPRTRIA